MCNSNCNIHYGCILWGKSRYQLSLVWQEMHEIWRQISFFFLILTIEGSGSCCAKIYTVSRHENNAIIKQICSNCITCDFIWMKKHRWNWYNQNFLKLLSFILHENYQLINVYTPCTACLFETLLKPFIIIKGLFNMIFHIKYA